MMKSSSLHASLLAAATALLLTAVACDRPAAKSSATAPEAEPPLAAAPPSPRSNDTTRISAVYICTGGPSAPVRIAADFVGDSAIVHLPTGTVRLPQALSGSGARYANDSALLWSKGEDAIIEGGGRSYAECHNDRGQTKR